MRKLRFDFGSGRFNDAAEVDRKLRSVEGHLAEWSFGYNAMNGITTVEATFYRDADADAFLSLIEARFSTHMNAEVIT